jgi:hypothetical protein
MEIVDSNDCSIHEGYMIEMEQRLLDVCLGHGNSYWKKQWEEKQWEDKGWVR